MRVSRRQHDSMSSPLNVPYPPLVTNGTKIRISIVIVSWNARKFLVECIQSISEQLCQSSGEIIVVDNASSDGSPEEVKRRFPAVRVIENEQNRGFATANNIGIQESAGEYIFLINSDVIVKPACISQLCRYMDEQPGVGIAGPAVLNSDSSLQTSVRPFPTFKAMMSRALGLDKIRIELAKSDSGLRSPIGLGYEADIVSGCFWVIRRAALVTVGLLDPEFFMYAEDKDWCVRFWKKGWTVAYVPVAEAIHYGGASSSNQPVRFYIELHKANLRYWRKHHGWLGSIIARSIMLLHQLVRILTGMLRFAFSRCHQRKHTRLVLRRSGACARFLVLGH